MTRLHGEATCGSGVCQERGRVCLTHAVACPRMLARGEFRRSLDGAWRHVKTPIAAIPIPNNRSAEENSNGGAAF
jgi:hypothetical protein